MEPTTSSFQVERSNHWAILAGYLTSTFIMKVRSDAIFRFGSTNAFIILFPKNIGDFPQTALNGNIYINCQ